MTVRAHIRVARAYDAPGPDDGTRVLVDRLWPRGLRKDDAPIDEWCKDVAPSTALRQWYGHRPERFAEFEQRYREELNDPEHRPALDHLLQLARAGPITLITASKDVARSNATVLAAVLSDLLDTA